MVLCFSCCSMLGALLGLPIVLLIAKVSEGSASPVRSLPPTSPVSPERTTQTVVSSGIPPSVSHKVVVDYSFPSPPPPPLLRLLPPSQPPPTLLPPWQPPRCPPLSSASSIMSTSPLLPPPLCPPLLFASSTMSTVAASSSVAALLPPPPSSPTIAIKICYCTVVLGTSEILSCDCN